MKYFKIFGIAATIASIALIPSCADDPGSPPDSQQEVVRELPQETSGATHLTLEDAAIAAGLDGFDARSGEYSSIDTVFRTSVASRSEDPMLEKESMFYILNRSTDGYLVLPADCRIEGTLIADVEHGSLSASDFDYVRDGDDERPYYANYPTTGPGLIQL